MTYFETINELKNGIDTDMVMSQEAYYETEEKLVNAIGEYVNGAEVNCKTLGTGKITSFAGTSIDSMFVEITFEDGMSKKYSLNHIMNNKFIEITSIPEIRDTWESAFEVHTNLTSIYNEFQRTLQQMQIEAEKKAKAEKKAEEKYQKQKEKALKDFDFMVQQANNTLSDVDEFYYALGWLAKHVGNIKAAIPDYLQTSFEQHFGVDANPYVVDSRKRTSGGFAFQWGIGMTANLRSKNLGTVPSFFTRYLNPTGKAITNTSFIWDLVDNYGFQFGKKQDVEKIKEMIPVKFITSFELGMTA